VHSGANLYSPLRHEDNEEPRSEIHIAKANPVVTFSRRKFLGLTLGSALSASAGRLFGQGVASHTAKPMARPAMSGRPFNAHFTDVASAAGLREPTIYGGVDSKKYILESTGCGCAFFDYDNDGWMDIFLLSGTRLAGEPP
jgi:hypothetical protein